MNAKLLAFLVGLLLVGAVTEATRFDCPANSTPTVCVPCDQYCNEELVFCTAVCTPGPNLCRCNTGFVRLNRTDNTCVSRADCPEKPPKCSSQ